MPKKTRKVRVPQHEITQVMVNIGDRVRVRIHVKILEQTDREVVKQLLKDIVNKFEREIYAVERAEAGLERDSAVLYLELPDSFKNGYLRDLIESMDLTSWGRRLLQTAVYSGDIGELVERAKRELEKTFEIEIMKKLGHSQSDASHYP